MEEESGKTKEVKENLVPNMKIKITSISIDSSATMVPFPLQDEVII